MERTEERGWYQADPVWVGEMTEQELLASTAATAASTAASGEATFLPSTIDAAADDPMQYTVPADESRDKCSICHIHFQMFFDNSEGMYKYSNCKEIEVLNDDAAEKESESVLVHVTCWRGLGSPHVLTMDQIF